MSERRTIIHKSIMVAAVSLALVALPFSVKVCHAAMIILLINWVMEGRWRIKISTVARSLLLQLFIAVFLLQVVGLLFADDFSRAWFSLEKKIFFVLVPLALATSCIRLNETEVKRTITFFVAACFAGTLICIVNAWQQTNIVSAGDGTLNPYLASSPYFDLPAGDSQRWLLFSYVSLSSGISIHPTYFSLFLGFSIIYLLNELPSAHTAVKKAAMLMLSGYFALFVVFLSSRVVILGLALIFVFVLVRCALANRRSFAIMISALAIAFTALLFINPVTRFRSVQEIKTTSFDIEPDTHYTSAAEIRLSLWWLGFSSLGHWNPLFGAGTGDVEKLMARTSAEYQITNVIGSFDPHNQFLYTLIANGAPALVLLILCLFMPAYWAWMHRDFLVIGFLFLFTMLCLTESALEVQKGIVFYALMSGLFFSQLYCFQDISFNFRSLLRVGQ